MSNGLPSNKSVFGFLVTIYLFKGFRADLFDFLDLIEFCLNDP